MEITTLIGIVTSFTALIVAIFWLGGSPVQFADPPSFMIVVVGTLAGVVASYSLKEILAIPKLLGVAFSKQEYDAVGCINTIVSLATIARKEGMLALDENANSLDDLFLRKGIMLVVDGTDPELVKNIMEAEITSIENRHTRGQSMWDLVSTLAPAYGMMGTVIALVLMLADLDDPETLGIGMATALITTFYGSILANAVAVPINTKLKTASGMELLYKEIMLEGLLSIQAGENPRIIEEKLYSFLAQSDKDQPALESGEDE